MLLWVNGAASDPFEISEYDSIAQSLNALWPLSQWDFRFTLTHYLR